MKNRESCSGSISIRPRTPMNPKPHPMFAYRIDLDYSTELGSAELSQLLSGKQSRKNLYLSFNSEFFLLVGQSVMLQKT